MDRFTLWEKRPSGGWQPVMTYRTLEDAREALDAWADDFLAEWGLVPRRGRDYRLTEDHAPDLRLEDAAPPPGSRPARAPGMPPPLRRMDIPRASPFS
jgi:hypothetical protein